MRWLYLSDLHLGRPDQAQTVAMRQIIKAISDTIGHDPLNFVLLAGDLAFSGQQDEYKSVLSEIIHPLRQLPSTKDAKFVSIPGNHDLDCQNILPISWEKIGRERQSVFWNSDDRSKALRFTRSAGFSEYTKFLAANDIHGPDPVVDVGSLITIQGDPDVSLICLNTALFSDKTFSEEDEKGKFPLPVQIFRQLAHESLPHTQIIVVGHHPLNWFEVQSRNQFQSALIENGTFYLHGHKHRVDVTFGPNYLRSLGFGAAYPTRLDAKSKQPYTSTFALCDLQDKLHVEFTSWDSSEGVWRPTHAGLPADLQDRSHVLNDGYVICTPNTKLESIAPGSLVQSSRIEKRSMLNRPIWIDGDRIKTWTTLLSDMGLIERGDPTKDDSPKQVPSHSTFFIKGRSGTHLVHGATAETSAITYSQVESANTQLDTLGLKSCVIATFGTITVDAKNLANNLQRSKNIEVLDGAAISERLKNGDAFLACQKLFAEPRREISYTPLAVESGLAILVVDAVQSRWFSVVGADGKICVEHDSLVATVKRKLPHLRSLAYKAAAHAVKLPVSQEATVEFDRSTYLARCMKIFNTAQYAGLAAVGVRLPVESLRQIYVPTSANVEQEQQAIKATERVIDELVETLGLDEHQRDQLSQQMKAKYGLGKTAEVGAARKLYQNFSNVAVLGDPGSGKSCFVRNEIMSYCMQDEGGEEDWYERHVPIFLPLAEYIYSSECPADILEQCSRHAKEQGLALEVQDIADLLARGKVAFFFDGLDEVSSISGRQRVLAELDALVESHAAAGNRFVVTSRPAATREATLPRAMARVSLLGLTDDEIRVLVLRLFDVRRQDSGERSPADQKVIDDILRDCSETPGIRRLARNPLLLTLLVFVYENSGAFAARRHLIYSQAVKTLVSVRHREIKRAKLSESDLRIRLGKVAMAIFRREESALPTRNGVLSILSDVMDMGVANDSDFIQDVAETTGLLIVHPRTTDPSNDLISFMHYSFLEYYTAVGFLEDHQGINIVSEFALNQRWREVVTLMFGILGEQSDITANLRLLYQTGGNGNDLTVSRLFLAFDCALECDVPPEDTQKFLAEEVDNVMSTGAGMYVSEVREQLGDRIALFLEATGSTHMRSMLLGGISADDERKAAAFVEMVTGMGGPFCEEEGTILRIGEALNRNLKILNLSIVNGLRKVPALRSPKNLDFMRRILRRGGIIEKTAVLQLLEEVPALIGGFESELKELLYAGKGVLAIGAADAVIRGGLFRREHYTDMPMFERALQLVMRNGAPRRSLNGVVRIDWDLVEDWVFSEDEKLRERGFRSLAVMESDVVRVHDLLFRCLGSEQDDQVLVAILNTLASYDGAIEAASLAETDQICGFTMSEFSNVRRAAARTLGSFPTMEVVSQALIDQFHQLKGRFNPEMRDVLRAIGGHAVRDQVCREVISDELKKVLRSEQVRWSKKNVAYISELLFASERFDTFFEDRDVRRLLEIARDYRSPPEVKRIMMRLFGQTCKMTSENLGEIVLGFKSDDSGQRLSAYRAGRRLVQRCRGQFGTVQRMVDGLRSAKVALRENWGREVSGVGDRGDGAGVREIRNLLMDIESTLGAYQEFSDRVTIEALDHE